MAGFETDNKKLVGRVLAPEQMRQVQARLAGAEDQGLDAPLFCSRQGRASLANSASMEG